MKKLTRSTLSAHWSIAATSLALLATVVACSKSSSTTTSPAVAEKDELNLIVPMPVSDQYAHPLVDSLRSGKGISRSLLLDAIYDAQYQAFQGGKDDATYEEFKIKLNTLSQQSKKISGSKIPGKAEIDQALESMIGGPIAYEPENFTILDILASDALQCDSGSVLHSYIQLDNSTGPEFERTHPVMLVEDGHYLPGFMIQQPISGKYRLIGANMTSSLKSIIDYGYAEELQYNSRVQKRGLRVLDGSTFLAMEAMGHLIETDAAYTEYETQVLKATAERYGIIFSELEKINSTVDQVSKSAALANATSTPSTRRRPGAFGDPGELKRIDVRPAGEGYDSTSELPVLEREVPVTPVSGFASGSPMTVSRIDQFAETGPILWNGISLDGLYQVAKKDYGGYTIEIKNNFFTISLYKKLELLYQEEFTLNKINNASLEIKKLSFTYFEWKIESISPDGNTIEMSSNRFGNEKVAFTRSNF